MTRRRLVGGLVLAVLLSVLVYAVLAAVTDARAALGAVADFPPLTFAGMLALALGGYTLRGLRWRYYARLLGHPASVSDALYIYFSGLTMTVTPGKVGEVLKAYLARELVGMPMPKGVTLLFIERQADLIAVLVLATGGLSLLPGAWFWIPGALLIVVLATLGISTRWFQALLLRLLRASGWIRRHDESVSAVSETMRLTLAFRPLAVAVPLSVVAWGAEGLSFYLCVRALGFAGLGFGSAVAIYGVSTVAGALAFFPGGIGLTEASLAGLLVVAGTSGVIAAAATVIVRVATLWFGVAAGWVAIATRPGLLRDFLRAPADETAADKPKARPPYEDPPSRDGS